MQRPAPAAFGTALIAVSLACAPPLAGDPPLEPLAVSRATTWIKAPLRSDGTPDYAAWITGRYAAGVTSANNAAPGLLAIRTVDDASLGLVEQILRSRTRFWIQPPGEMEVPRLCLSRISE